MLNTLRLGKSIDKITATDDSSENPLERISSFHIPSLNKLRFNGTAICLFYKTSSGRIKTVIFEGRRGPNTDSPIETFTTTKTEAFIEELYTASDTSTFAHFASHWGYKQEDLIKTIWSAALENLSIDQLYSLLWQCRLS